jgi:hypothetical protein
VILGSFNLISDLFFKMGFTETKFSKAKSLIWVAAGLVTMAAFMIVAVFIRYEAIPPMRVESWTNVEMCTLCGEKVRREILQCFDAQKITVTPLGQALAYTVFGTTNNCFHEYRLVGNRISAIRLKTRPHFQHTTTGFLQGDPFFDSPVLRDALSAMAEKDEGLARRAFVWAEQRRKGSLPDSLRITLEGTNAIALAEALKTAVVIQQPRKER